MSTHLGTCPFHGSLKLHSGSFKFSLSKDRHFQISLQSWCGSSLTNTRVLALAITMTMIKSYPGLPSFQSHYLIHVRITFAVMGHSPPPFLPLVPSPPPPSPPFCLFDPRRSKFVPLVSREGSRFGGRRMFSPRIDFQPFFCYNCSSAAVLPGITSMHAIRYSRNPNGCWVFGDEIFTA